MHALQHACAAIKRWFACRQHGGQQALRTEPGMRVHDAQVPLKRVNQAYVIATSTKVDVSSVEAGHLEDGAFKAAEKKAEKKKEGDAFFKDEAEDKPKVALCCWRCCCCWLLEVAALGGVMAGACCMSGREGALAHRIPLVVP